MKLMTLSYGYPRESESKHFASRHRSGATIPALISLNCFSKFLQVTEPFVLAMHLVLLDLSSKNIKLTSIVRHINCNNFHSVRCTIIRYKYFTALELVILLEKERGKMQAKRKRKT